MAAYINNFSETEKTVTSSDLDELERRLGFSFPRDIYDHYLLYNGGCPSRYLFRKDDVIYVIQEFFPVRYGKSKCLFEDIYTDLKIERDVLPKHLVPFADDPGGEFYCFGIRDEDAGSIFFYNGEYYDDPDRAVTYLAKTLFDFIEGMVAEE